MTLEQVLAEFKKAGALLEGHFILSSGLHSDTFPQKALVFQDARRTAKLCEALAAMKAPAWEADKLPPHLRDIPAGEQRAGVNHTDGQNEALWLSLLRYAVALVSSVVLIAAILSRTEHAGALEAIAALFLLPPAIFAMLSFAAGLWRRRTHVTAKALTIPLFMFYLPMTFAYEMVSACATASLGNCS